MALDAFDAERHGGAGRTYLVLPPGAGKTALGLETARRIGRRALVLTPNTAVQAQWLAQWGDFCPADRADHPVPAGASRDLGVPLTVLTYQAVAVLDRSPDVETEDDEVPVTPADGRRRRQQVMRTGTHRQLLNLLHANGRAMLDDAQRLGPWTLVLDEAHHLLEMWGALVRAVVTHLGDDTAVVGLTATPPVELTRWQLELQRDLFPRTTFEVPLPAVVKEGDLAPYQELVYLTAPTPEEDTWISTERARFASLQVELVAAELGTIPLLTWLTRRLVDRATAPDGSALSWAQLETDAPELSRAGLRFAHAGLIPVPDGARLREEHRVEPDADDWVAVLEDFVTGHLARSSDPADVQALADIRAVLPSLGYRFTSTGTRIATSTVERVVTLSSAKAAAAAHLLDVEHSARGDQLRAVVLTDFETATAETPATLRRAGITRLSGSARLMLTTLSSTVVAGERGRLRPVLVTGTTVAAAAAVAAELLAHCRALHPDLDLRLEPLDGADSVLRVAGGPGWRPRTWIPAVTDFFDGGGSLVLVGTRSLLGEGWDCPRVNVSVDVSTAATATSVLQMRGRTMRLDAADPQKLSSNWTVTCVAHGHPRGDADYLRLVRKHRHHFAATAEGVVESGVTHCDPTLSPFAPPPADELVRVTARALDLAVRRDDARLRWRIGEPYEGREVATLRLRSERPVGAATGGLPRTALAPADAPGAPSLRGRTLGPVAAPAGAVAAAVGGALAADQLSIPIAVGGGTGVIVAGGVVVSRLAISYRTLSRTTANGALDQLARATADALLRAGLTSAGATAVAFTPTVDGWLATQLTGVPASESTLFGDCLDELLSPLADPRHLVGRLVFLPPTSPRRRLALATRRSLGRPIDAAVSWHAVPTALGRNRERLAHFLAAWEQWVGPPFHHRADSAEGRALLDLYRSEDPFAITSQLRTQWR